ncbi:MULTISPECIES: hypothetical protein [unclassified Paenibacillus]|uniref:hypothetical protein n=1 Tax=unclassified Paenibacillus TaxID=185978 RepID=UPI0027816B61|nr:MULTISPECIES: hypothetical protein [unclassified Paenibacillus]MDQ0896270.1 hypothetical protein [Paenibacillus sp. V4I7]MDQ0913802.1 hypothetical protein [Paenibacillus sp. V4I5]
MSSSLNAILRPTDPVTKKPGSEMNEHRKSANISETKQVIDVPKVKPTSPPKHRTRNERADKKKDIKFPVTPAQREELRKLAKELRIENKDPSKKYETISNTHVLKKALEQYSIFPERYPPLVYSDTGQYMHAELLLRDFDYIEELARKMNLSIRKTVYRLIMNYIHRGEVDSDAYREGR